MDQNHVKFINNIRRWLVGWHTLDQCSIFISKAIHRMRVLYYTLLKGFTFQLQFYCAKHQICAAALAPGNSIVRTIPPIENLRERESSPPLGSKMNEIQRKHPTHISVMQYKMSTTHIHLAHWIKWVLSKWTKREWEKNGHPWF